LTARPTVYQAYDLIKAFPKLYETKTYPGKGTVTIFAYRCIPCREKVTREIDSVCFGR
jgi:hypothetical protein